MARQPVRVRCGLDERPFPGQVSLHTRHLVYVAQLEGASFELEAGDRRIHVRPLSEQRRKALAVVAFEVRDLLLQERARPS